MIQLDMVRVSQGYMGADKGGMYGVLINPNTNVPFALTLEQPWEDNKKFKSCIPSGVYVCQAYKSKDKGGTFVVNNVPGRSGILFHKGNTTDDTGGCILIGESFGYVKGKDGVLSSKEGFNEFMDILGDEKYFLLWIRGEV